MSRAVHAVLGWQSAPKPAVLLVFALGVARLYCAVSDDKTNLLTHCIHGLLLYEIQKLKMILNKVVLPHMQPFNYVNNSLGLGQCL